MSYNPEMELISHQEMLDYLDERIQAQFCFAWRKPCPPHPLCAWKTCEYHAVTVLAGKGRIETVFREKTNVSMTRLSGQACLLPGGVARRVAMIPGNGGEPLDILALGVRYKIFGTIDLLSFWQTPRLFGPEDSAGIRALLEDLVASEQDAGLHPVPRAVRRKRACFGILDLILRRSSPAADFAARLGHYEILRPALELLARDYRLPLTVEQLARACHLSRSQFHQVFREFAGVAPLEYQQRQRLAEAQNLLLGSAMTVAEVGAAVGWNDAFHFSRIFKKACGAAPRHFRQRGREDIGTFF